MRWLKQGQAGQPQAQPATRVLRQDRKAQPIRPRARNSRGAWARKPEAAALRATRTTPRYREPAARPATERRTAHRPEMEILRERMDRSLLQRTRLLHPRRPRRILRTTSNSAMASKSEMARIEYGLSLTADKALNFARALLYSEFMLKKAEGGAGGDEVYRDRDAGSRRSSIAEDRRGGDFESFASGAGICIAPRAGIEVVVPDGLAEPFGYAGALRRGRSGGALRVGRRIAEHTMVEITPRPKMARR